MRLLSKYELFIFDWDHTLTTSTLVVTLLNLLNRKRRSGSMEKFKRMRRSEFTAKNIEVKEEISKIYSIFDDAYAMVFRPKLKPSAIQLLAMLKQRGKKVAIFSDSKTYRLLKETELLGVLDYVDFALSAESIGYYKPDPTGLLLLLDRFHVKKGKALYIGDMAGDVLTAKLAGLDSCAVADGIDSFDSLRKEGPDHIYARLDSFIEALEGKKQAGKR